MKVLKRFRIRDILVRRLAELAGFGVLVYAGWQLHEVAGLLVLSVVLLLYGNVRGA